jgi:hypothetical protein
MRKLEQQNGISLDTKLSCKTFLGSKMHYGELGSAQGRTLDAYQPGALDGICYSIYLPNCMRPQLTQLT